MLKINQYKTLAIDCCIIILNISIYTTVLPSVIFGNWEAYFHQLFIFILNVLYLFRHSKVSPFIKLTKKNFLSFSIITAFSLMFLLEIPRYFIGALEGTNIFKTLLSGFSILSFAIILNNIHKKYTLIYGQIAALTLIIKFYVYFCLTIVFISNFVVVLWFLGFIDIFSNPIKYGFSTFIDNNMATLNAAYFSPLNITIVTNEMRFANLATFSGISYEPHIAAHFMAPAMFMLNGLEDISKVKKIFYTASFLLFIISGSAATAAVVLFSVYLYLLFSNLTLDVKNTVVSLGLLIILIAIFYYAFEIIESSYIFSKATTTSGSSDYSARFLEYVISPKTIWGDGVFNVPYPYASLDNIGLIFCTLIVYFYIVGIFVSMASIRNHYKNKLIKFISMGLLYFFLHSLKIVQLIFIFPYTIFMIFVLFAAHSLPDKSGIKVK